MLKTQLLLLAALLAIGIGVLHSVLGERFILARLFRSDSLPKLYGSTVFTQRVLRFAWHLTSIAWWGFAVILAQLAWGRASASDVAATVGATFVITALVTALASRGRHFAWPVFALIGAISLWAA